MAVIELHTFRLAEGTDTGHFLEVDARAQTDFAYRQPGLVRRTTARTDEGEWLVVTMWATSENAESAREAAVHDAAAGAFAGQIDAASATVRRYVTLD